MNVRRQSSLASTTYHYTIQDKACNADEATLAHQSHVLAGQSSKVPGSEYSWERKFQGAKVPRNESSKERKGPGAKVPGSELASVLLELSLPRVNWPGSEKAVNQTSHTAYMASRVYKHFEYTQCI